MCSVNEIEQIGDSSKSKKSSKRRDKGNSKNFSGEGSCMKCPEKAVVLVRNNDPFCRTCFLDYIMHKFRATIGKARVIHQGQKVLLAVSGGSAPMAMLDLVIKGLGKAAVKKHRFQPGVVHIDDEGLCGQSVNERHSVKHHIEELARVSGFPYHSVSLADLFIHQDNKTCLDTGLQELDISNEQENISKGVKRLQELFENVSTVTAKEDLLTHLYRNLLQKIAKDHGYDYIMVGDCGSSIAVRILADVAQGRGSQLPFNVSFKDGRSEVLVLRPMREFTKKEIQFYNCFNNVTSFTIPSFTSKASSHESVNRLTEELIIGLQACFPSTLNTVLRTGDKLSSSVDSADSQHCVLCLAPLGIYSGFSEVFTELTTCGGGECGPNGGCQEPDGDGSAGYQTGDGGISTDDGGVGCKNSDGGDDINRSSTGPRGTMVSNNGTISDSCGHNSTHVLRDSGVHTGKLGSDDDGTFGSSGGTHVGDQNIKGHTTVVRSLCYGCKLTCNDLRDGEVLLPEVIAEKSEKQFQTITMKERIQNFLQD